MRSSNLGIKRARTDELSSSSYRVPPARSVADTSKTSSPASNTATSGSSSFRNVSACNRCRLRKNRCDQNLPACSLCEKAGVKCVGFDPITKREIPRTYVYYLESRLNYLETLLADNGIPFAPSQEFDAGTQASSAQPHDQSPSDPSKSNNLQAIGKNRMVSDAAGAPRETWPLEQEEEGKLNKLVSNISSGSVQGATDPHYLDFTSGISFTRFAIQARGRNPC